MVNALIFSAGLGTRLKPLTDTMPKALVPLAGKPLLQWQVEKLRDAGITDITVNVHHFPDMIIDTIRRNNGWGCNISVSDERDCLLDTGGGLKKVKSEILNPKSEILNTPILACNVDILSNIDIRALITQYEQTGVSQLVVSERQTQRYLLFDEQNLLRGWTNIATGELKPSSLQGEELRSIERPEDGRRTSGGRLPIESIREGEVPGTHEVKWDSEEDTIIITHIAKGRRGFALGAVLAAEALNC